MLLIGRFQMSRASLAFTLSPSRAGAKSFVCCLFCLITSFRRDLHVKWLSALLPQATEHIDNSQANQVSIRQLTHTMADQDETVLSRTLNSLILAIAEFDSQVVNLSQLPDNAVWTLHVYHDLS